MNNVLEEIQVNAEMIDEVNNTSGGAGGTGVRVVYGLVSWYLGNSGYVCTWTVECMTSCK